MVLMSRFKKFVIALALGLGICALGKPALAQSVIKQPGNHPNYSFEAEPHLLLGLWGVPGPGGGTGLGAGFRGSIVIVDNGFVKTINNSVAISFGLDWVHYEIDDWCGRYWRGNGAPCGWDDDADLIWLPVTMQWNFWLTRSWSVFGEPGLAIRLNDDHYNDDIDLDFVFYAGGRYHFNDTMSLTMRLGWPSAFSIGLSFFL
jgi:hypothetical protein